MSPAAKMFAEGSAYIVEIRFMVGLCIFQVHKHFSYVGCCSVALSKAGLSSGHDFLKNFGVRV